MPEVSAARLQAIQEALAAFDAAYGELSRMIRDRSGHVFLERRDGEVREALAGLREALSDLPTAGPAAPAAVPAAAPAAGGAQRRREDSSSIADFFHAVGKGVVDAQKSLDERSRDYMAEARGFPPTAFRLPKASAEIQFGIENVTSEGFDIFVARREDTTRESMQHRVSFDIVSTPLPPEVLSAMAAQTVTLPFLGSPVERAALRARLLAFAAGDQGTPTAREAAAALAEPARFRRALAFDLPGLWFLLTPALEEDKPKYELAYLQEGETLSFTQNVITLPKGQGPVVEALIALAARQAPIPAPPGGG